MASPSYTSTARLTCHLCEELRADYYAAWGNLSAFQTRKLNGDDSERWRYMELRRAMQDAARTLGEGAPCRMQRAPWVSTSAPATSPGSST
jgi:hypothetical protein